MTIHFDFSDLHRKSVTRIAMTLPGQVRAMRRCPSESRRAAGEGGEPRQLRARWIRCPASGRVIMQWRVSGG